MTKYYSIMEMQGDGSSTDPRRVSDWLGTRIDFHCRIVRANLGCFKPDGSNNPAIRDFFQTVTWEIYQDCSPCWGVYSVELPDSYAGQVSPTSMLATEPSPAGPLIASDPVTLQHMCHAHSVNVAVALNNANLGFSIGSATPYADVISALGTFTAAQLGPLSTALRARYVTRLHGTNTGGFPSVLLTNGQWNVTGMVAYANLLDTLPLSDPRNLIHILYLLGGTMVLSASLPAS